MHPRVRNPRPREEKVGHNNRRHDVAFRNDISIVEIKLIFNVRVVSGDGCRSNLAGRATTTTKTSGLRLPNFAAENSVVAQHAYRVLALAHFPFFGVSERWRRTSVQSSLPLPIVAARPSGRGERRRMCFFQTTIVCFQERLSGFWGDT